MTPLHLRVDVCTYRGLRDGVPGVLEVLKKVGARATFYITFGPDASGLALLKMLNPSFAWKMLRTNAVGTYGLATAFYGTLLPSPMVGSGLPEIVKRVRDEGHEVGLHGWDHRRWQDKLAKYKPERLRDEFRKMVDAYRGVFGAPAASFAAPAWLVTAPLLELEHEAGFAFASDARGSRPFLPRFDGRDWDIPQLPVTLPTLDESLGHVTREKFVEEIVRSTATQTGYCCFTAHAEAEGREYRAELEAILTRVARPAVPLSEAPRADLPRCEMRLSEIPGRPYPVCTQISS